APPDGPRTGGGAGAGDADGGPGDPLPEAPTVERQRQSVPWGGETPWGGSKHPMPPFRRRVMIRALSMLFTPPDPSRRVRHGEPVHLAGREWTSLHTPGHTLHHLRLYHPTQRD